MSPRVQRTGYQWLCVLLATVDTGWAVYLLSPATDEFRRSVIWSSVLHVVPAHDPAGVGFALAVLAALSWAGFAVGRSLARISFIALAGIWSLLAGGFVYCAATEGGLGAGGAIWTVAAVLLHVGVVAYYPPDYR